MVIGLAIIVIAGMGGLLAGYVLWRASHLGGLWGLFAGVLLGVAVFVIAILIGYVMVRSTDLLQLR
jgi:hypothetical protein